MLHVAMQNPPTTRAWWGAGKAFWDEKRLGFGERFQGFT